MPLLDQLDRLKAVVALVTLEVPFLQNAQNCHDIEEAVVHNKYFGCYFFIRTVRFIFRIWQGLLNEKRRLLKT